MSDYFDFSVPQKQTENTLLSKVNEIMCWDAYPGETPEDVFIRNGKNINDLPSNEIIDIIHSGGLQKWSESMKVDSEFELYDIIFKAIRKCISEPAFMDKKKAEIYPAIFNFFVYCQSLDRRGKVHKESEMIAEQSWYGKLASSRLKKKTAEMFNVYPDITIYNEIVVKIKDIWGYSDAEIDALRYFVCQVKDAGRTINPSQNKQIYMWSKQKETGKTSIARAIVSVLNGEEFANNSKFESSLGRELQFNTHDFPMAAIYNAVILDEAMPNDSSKVYGPLKKMLTSSGCDFNPKYNTMIHMECHRNYIFTSNDCITDYIKDDSDRRFIIVEPKNKPKQISFNDIFETWKLFCQHATPRMKWAEWYRQFDFIDGQQTKNIQETKQNILSNPHIISELESQSIYSISVGYFNKLLTNTQTPSTEIRKTIKLSCLDLFGETIQKGGSAWKRNDILLKLRTEQTPLYNEIDIDSETPKLPF